MRQIDQLVSHQNQVIVGSGATFAMPDTRTALLNALIASGNVVAAPGATLATPVVAGGMVTITATSTGGLLGDYNHNGIVDAADYIVWRKSLGTSGANLPADGNGDNMITSADYDVWKSHFGQHSGMPAGTISGVPEPSGATFGDNCLDVCHQS